MSELSNLNYRGNHFPRFLKWIWAIAFVGFAYYLWKYSWPDLLIWLKK